MIKVLFTFASLLLISCGSTKLATPTQADVDRGMKKYPDLTLEALNTGKANFETSCSKCHGLKKPGSKTAAQWEAVVPRMATKAEKKAGGKVVIDTATRESIVKYLSSVTTK